VWDFAPGRRANPGEDLSVKGEDAIVAGVHIEQVTSSVDLGQRIGDAVVVTEGSQLVSFKVEGEDGAVASPVRTACTGDEYSH
jgi:hypothetical protein